MNSYWLVSSHLWIFITVINFHFSNKFSSQWWIFIIVINFYQIDGFPWQVQILITVLNFYSSEEFSSQRYYFYHPCWHSFSLNLNLNFGWAWPSSALAGPPFLACPCSPTRSYRVIFCPAKSYQPILVFLV